MKNKIMRFAMATGIGLTLASGAWAAPAATRTWTNHAMSTDWFVPSNWDPNVLPGEHDRASFNIRTNTVLLTGPVSVTSLHVRAWGGNTALTFDVGGHNFLASLNTATATDGFRVDGDSGRRIDLVITSSLPGGVFDVRRARVGEGGADRTHNVAFAGSNLTVQLAGADWLAGGTSDVGLNMHGFGMTRMSDGVTVHMATNAVLFGHGLNAQGPTWLITDPGTTFTNRHHSPLFVGTRATNDLFMSTMIVSNRARAWMAASGSTIEVGNGRPWVASFGGRGRIIVTGSGSEMFVLNSRFGQMGGNAARTAGGFLLVEHGGRYDNAGFLDLGVGVAGGLTNELAYGQIIARGAGSVVRIWGALNAGFVGHGDVRVESGGRLEAGSAVLGSGLASGHTNRSALGTLEVTGAGSTGTVAGALTVGAHGRGYGTVTVSSNATLQVTSETRLWDRGKLTVSDALFQGAALAFESNTTLRLELASTNTSIRLGASLLTVHTNVNMEIAFLDRPAFFQGLAVHDDISLITYGTRSGVFSGWVSGVTTINHTPSYAGAGQYTFLYDRLPGEDVLTVTVIPEPGTLGLIGVGLGLAALLRRRRV